MTIKQDFYTAREISELWGVTVRMISHYCTKGEIPGAEKVGNMWLIPRGAKKPLDGRRKTDDKQ